VSAPRATVTRTWCVIDRDVGECRGATDNNVPKEELPMTIRSKLALPLALALCVSLAPAAFAQDTKSNMSKPMDDKMAKPDAMAKPAASKDAMGKGDGKMADPMKKDGMKK
jgi:pentapeptide MXKDX repeat protein